MTGQRADVFVTGTDTGVGKTLASAALLAALNADGRRAFGMKPVASGCEFGAAGWRSADALLLRAAGAQPPPHYGLGNPYTLPEAVSPHLAAAAAGIEIALHPIRAAYATLAAQCDHVVVEGVGGWYAPLSDRLMQSELALALELPVILVIGLRLGCLNHALLTARAIAADGVNAMGWIGSRIDPAMARADDNLATLERLLPFPCLGVLPYAPDATPAQRGAFLLPAVHILRQNAATRLPAGSGDP